MILSSFHTTRISLYFFVISILFRPDVWKFSTLLRSLWSIKPIPFSLRSLLIVLELIYRHIRFGIQFSRFKCMNIDWFCGWWRQTMESACFRPYLHQFPRCWWDACAAKEEINLFCWETLIEQLKNLKKRHINFISEECFRLSEMPNYYRPTLNRSINQFSIKNVNISLWVELALTAPNEISPPLLFTSRPAVRCLALEQSQLCRGWRFQLSFERNNRNFVFFHAKNRNERWN